MNAIYLTIPDRLPGLNEVNNANRTHKLSGARMKKRIERGLVILIKNQCKVSFTKVQLNFKWYEPNRRRDFDNIASAKKFILDALVKAEVIPNDGWKNIALVFKDEFFLDKEDPRIEVEIIPIE